MSCVAKGVAAVMVAGLYFMTWALCRAAADADDKLGIRD